MSEISKAISIINFQDSILTKYESIVLDTHDTLEDVLAGILEDEEMSDEEEESGEEEASDKENIPTQIDEATRCSN